MAMCAACGKFKFNLSELQRVEVILDEIGTISPDILI